MKVLLIEDSPEIAESVSLCISLRWPYCTVTWTAKGEEGVMLARDEGPDVIIVDLGLPDLEGFDVVRRIREFSDVPIAIVSVRGDEVSKVKGLELGADDYIPKPFSHTEFLARINALLRRSHMPHLAGRTEVLNANGLQIDFAARRVFLEDHEIELTPMEWNLLSYLVRNEGRIIPHDVLAERVWGTRYIGRSAIKMCVRRLREKLGQDEHAALTIRSHRGRGYSLSIDR